MPISLSAVEACPLLARQIQSIGFTLTRTFMKLFHTGSSSTVKECQVNLGFLPAFLPAQIVIRTASFLPEVYRARKYSSLCTLFANDARPLLHNIFKQYGTNIKTACQLRNAIYIKFFDNF